jgi:hypothetical protein
MKMLIILCGLTELGLLALWYLKPEFRIAKRADLAREKLTFLFIRACFFLKSGRLFIRGRILRCMLQCEG